LSSPLSISSASTLRAVRSGGNDSAGQRRCDVTVRVEAPLTGEQLERLEKVAATCPVRKALEGAVSFTEQIA